MHTNFEVWVISGRGRGAFSAMRAWKCMRLREGGRGQGVFGGIPTRRSGPAFPSDRLDTLSWESVSPKDGFEGSERVEKAQRRSSRMACFRIRPLFAASMLYRLNSWRWGGGAGWCQGERGCFLKCFNQCVSVWFFFWQNKEECGCGWFFSVYLSAGLRLFLMCACELTGVRVECQSLQRPARGQ